MTLTCADGSGVGCEATYYTLDGSTPTASSLRYTVPLLIETTARLRFLSLDRAGNAEAARSAEYVVDSRPPTVSSTPRSGIYGRGHAITLSCDDGSGSGCASIHYTSDGSAPSTASAVYSSPLQLPPSGMVRLRFIAVDRAGHVSEEGSEQFVVDTHPPVSTASHPWGSYAAPIELTLSCSDTGSGCARIHYTLDGTTPTRNSPVYERPLRIESRTRVGFFAVDAAGNEEYPWSLPFVVDTTPPVTVASPAGGTFNTSMTVFLSCNDGSGSGCATTYYSFARDVNAPAPPFQKYSGTTGVVESGVLRFYSVDEVGHAGPVQMVTFLIDGTKPSASAAPKGGTYFTPQTVTLTCTDTGGAGCAHIYYSLDGYWPNRESPRYTRPLVFTKDTQLVFFAVDGAGNSSAYVQETYVFKSDTTAPTTVANPAGGLFRAAQSVTLACSDGSGIGCSSTRYTLDGSEPSESNGFTYSEPIALSSATRLRFRSVDGLGQWEQTRQAEYDFDMDVPRTQAEPVGGTFDGPIVVRLTCQDVGTGCAETRYTVDGSEPSSTSPLYTAPLPVGQSTTVRFASVDTAGNVEATRRETYVLDASTLASAQIAAVRASYPSPTEPKLIDGAFITFVKPAVGTTQPEPEGFFLQAETSGPALFVEVPLASLNPVPVGGERVRVQVNRLSRGWVYRAGIDVASFTVLGTGYPMKALAQDVSRVVLPTSLSIYDSELVTLHGELAGVYASEGAGTGFSSIRIATPGVPTGSSHDYRMLFRLPELEQRPELTRGCLVSFTSPLWANNGYAQPTLWKWEQMESVTCAAPRVVFAQALSGGQVQVRFDRRLDASSVDASGGQFSIQGLTVTGAVIQGTSEVWLQTSAQVTRGQYEVTVSDSLTDRLGARVQAPFNTYRFRGYATPARLRISEVDPSREFGAEGRVELEVVQAGPMTNITLSAGAIAEPLATLPDVDVAVGDIVVVHIAEVRPTGNRLTRSEVTGKDELPSRTYPLAHDAAWDVRGTTSFRLGQGDRVLRLRDSFGNLLDGLALIDTGLRVSSFVAELNSLQDEQGWKPALCGGARCSYATSPTVDDISVNMKPLFDSGGGSQSLCRIRVEDSDGLVDWAVRNKSVGLPNL